MTDQPVVRVLDRNEAMLWKELRLRALQESPDAFRTTFESQQNRPDSDWQRQIDETAGSRLAEGFVAEVDGEAVGLLRCRLTQSDPPLGFIQTMWVEPRFRRRGIGSQLLTFGLNWLRDRGAGAIELDVNERNEAALDLYRSFGFEFTGYQELMREGSAHWIARMRCLP